MTHTEWRSKSEKQEMRNSLPLCDVRLYLLRICSAPQRVYRLWQLCPKEKKQLKMYENRRQGGKFENKNKCENRV